MEPYDMIVVSEELLNGKIIVLDKFGAFRLTVEPNWEDSTQDLDACNIKDAKLRCKPG